MSPLPPDILRVTPAQQAVIDSLVAYDWMPAKLSEAPPMTGEAAEKD